MKAMILAAGRGERLRPLTDTVPKPLVQVGGKPLIAWHLERLAAAGFREVVINVSHLADAIIGRVGDGSAFGLRVAWSRESEPLETAGGLANAQALLGRDAFLLINADIYVEYDFARLRGHALGSRLAHLVLVPNPPHRTAGDFSLEGDLIGNAGTPRYTYSGIAVLAPALCATLTPGQKAPLAPLLRAAAEHRLAGGELHLGIWRDIGTAERLAELDALLRSRDAARS
jgi:MurNAc alpha-1-phosphate uridylyltransferase